jgi:molybdopterin-guanine dinucleotide biosynthesis protein A
LGGIETALRRAKTGHVLFLSCDMPFLQPDLVEQLLAMNAPAAFTAARGKVGFPFCLSREILPKVAAQLAAGQLSLQAFARKIRARRLRVPKADWPQLDNLNTPAELAAARERLQ